jgi:hypothetical protein
VERDVEWPGDGCCYMGVFAASAPPSPGGWNGTGMSSSCNVVMMRGE